MPTHKDIFKKTFQESLTGQMQMGITSLPEKTFSPTCICDANGNNFPPTFNLSTHLLKRIYGDNFIMRTNMIAGATCTNTVNIVKKLVTVFAEPYLDSLQTLKHSNYL